MSSHPAEVELRDLRIELFKAACLAKFDTPRLNRGGDALNLAVLCHPRIVCIAFINVACVRAHQTSLECLQFRPIINEAEQYRFEARGARVILLVRVRWGSDDG